ncbi:hypothetical protein E5288_WYG015629 [Bos mutus]|uniref:Uncharacterized protein n=1 Tax=Bos mutus TaxID=72004 RepID=A0A6B0SH40_9CETA|nr:hypothetical protein [Bos mutus]
MIHRDVSAELAEFFLEEVTPAQGGSYHCCYWRRGWDPDVWSHPSDALELLVTDPGVEALPPCSPCNVETGSCVLSSALELKHPEDGRRCRSDGDADRLSPLLAPQARAPRTTPRATSSAWGWAAWFSSRWAHWSFSTGTARTAPLATSGPEPGRAERKEKTLGSHGWTGPAGSPAAQLPE